MQARRRRLPHIYVVGQPLFVTFRLHGSLPKGKYFSSGTIDSGEAFACLDLILDDGRTGPAWLKVRAVADLVAEEVHMLNPHAWVVMPNHVHLLFTPNTSTVALLQGLKGRTAQVANKILNRTGQPFWQEESYDHLVRDARQFATITNYIHQNPVRAGVAASAEDYEWSSARVLRS